MTEAYVSAFSCALGERTFSVEESVAAQRTLSDAPALRSAGFGSHHICTPGTTAYDLARAAVEPILDKLGSLDAIVYATCLPLNANVGPAERYAESHDVKYLMDYPASRLQAALRQDRAQVIGINQQACTSMLGSLRLARALLASEPGMRRVLCITADRFPDGAIYEQAYNLISDGAAAALVTNVPAGFRIVACDHITNGAMVIASDDETVGSYFSYTHRVVTNTLAKAKLAPDQISWVVPQNTNLAAWKILSRIFSLGMERVFCPTLPSCGHIISGDNILNMQSLVESGKVKSGEYLLLLMAGYGMNWQCTILEAV
jgi:3-oxoacyl-[acyl-carrier-protein] synthase-3